MLNLADLDSCWKAHAPSIWKNVRDTLQSTHGFDTAVLALAFEMNFGIPRETADALVSKVEVQLDQLQTAVEQKLETMSDAQLIDQLSEEKTIPMAIVAHYVALARKH